MDEPTFRHTRDSMSAHPCAFQNAMLAGACGCALAARRSIAEREAIDCASPPARDECEALRALLRRNSAFALKLTQIDAALPHAKEMKLQCGGLQGVERALAGAGASATAADVHALVRAASAAFRGLQNLPYAEIVQAVAAHQIRRRRTQR